MFARLRRRISRLLVLPALLGLLALGIWLGGHPRWLPGPVARPARRRRRRTRRRRGDRPRSTTPTTARSPTTDLADDGDRRAWSRARRPLLELLHPAEYTRFEDVTRQRVLRASGLAVRGRPARPAGRDGLRRLARRARRDPRRRRHRRAPTGRDAGRAQPERGVDRPHQGPAGDRRHAARRCATARRHERRSPARRSRSRSSPSRMRASRRRARLGIVGSRQFSSGAHGEVYAASQAPEARARRASSSTCAATAAASSTRRSSSPARSCAERHDRHDPGALRARAHADGDRRAGRRDAAARRARRQRHRVGVGDRRRRAAGPRAARRSSAPGRSARASSRRSSSCPTAARWTSPPASTSRRRAQPRRRRASGRGAGIAARRARARTTPRRRSATRPCDGALDVLARQAVSGGRRAAGGAPRSPPRGARSARPVDKRGRFLVAEPFFERGRAGDARARPATRAPGDLALVRSQPRAAGRAQVAARRSARPDVAARRASRR